MNKSKAVAIIAILVFRGQALGQTGTKKRRSLPYEYGRVIINSYSEKAKLAPVVFERWIHRAKFTCRVCYVDIGFAMKAGGTDIKAVDNERGYYCGSCHNWKRVVEGKTTFQACSESATSEDAKRCDRCHTKGKKVGSDYDFFRFSESIPKERFGNGIDREKSEELGLIKPAGLLDGVSVPRDSLVVRKDFALSPQVEGMPDIIFSHTKHTVWNGCELCHPEIFMGVKRGACHDGKKLFDGSPIFASCKDAAPNQQCGRCHSLGKEHTRRYEYSSL